MHPGAPLRLVIPGAIACALAAGGAGAQHDPGAFTGPPAPIAAPGPATATSEAPDAPAVAPATDAPPAIESRPLGAPPTSRPASGEPGAGFADTFAGNWVGRTILALALVIGLAILLRAGLRRAASGGAGLVNQLGAGGRAPSGLLSVLGRYPVGRGQTLVLLKVDRRVLLLSQSGAGFTTLCEMADPEEVASILMTARDEEGASMAARFTTVLRDLERDPRIADVEQAPGAWGPTTPRVRMQREQAVESADPVAQLRRRLASLTERGG